MNELIFEIGTEEIPAGYIQPALDFLASEAAKKLEAMGLAFADLRTLGTPRRLTLSIGRLQSRQDDRSLEHIGPSKKAGFDAAGKLTRAAEGFARSKGIEPAQLQVVETAKGAYLMAIEDVKGQDTLDLLPGLLESLIRDLVFPKSMRWADNALTFARPIQWLLGLYGGQTIALTIENISCGSVTRGHRFMAPQTVEVTGIDQYHAALKEHFVIVDPVERRQRVVEEVRRAVAENAGVSGARPVVDEGLLDIVTNLVEYPTGICGRFDEKFLQVPEDVLVTSMREHQKYFPVADAEGRLLPLFVAVNNTVVKDRKLAASGHERVLRARLEDGLFFFKEDRKKPLASRIGQLHGIVFQNRLGTMQEKSERIRSLAAQLADRVAPEVKEVTVRAAQLAKADLLTAMVNEFPSLQGIMGREYARHDGESPLVAQAIEEHYLPLRAGSAIPGTIAGALVGIADRLDTLVGCFAIGERPTGNKDAFGLRRQAIGLISIIKGRQISFSLREMTEAALKAYGAMVEQNPETANEVVTFIRLRFENEQIASGLSQEVVEAATAVGFDNVTDCLARIEALSTLRGEEGFSVLAGSFKRIRNIIKDNRTTEVNPDLLREQAEIDLLSALAVVREKALPLIWDRDYRQALTEMLEMKGPVDRFFDQVMVMAEDAAVRQNRLNLLTALGELVLHVGDISRMHVDKE